MPAEPSFEPFKKCPASEERVAKNASSQTPEEDGVKYYMNGQIYKKMTYSDGVLDGPWEQFYPNGQLHYEGMFKKGRPEGDLIMYYVQKRQFQKRPERRRLVNL
jgi:antitoxin component YwqK of YwqJK toxin-antitoxin module